MRTSLAALMLAAMALATACGVAFSPAPEGNDFFDSLRITGEKRVGATLTATVSVEQTYPLDVELRCEVLEDDDPVKEIGAASAPALEGGSPDATPAAQHFTFEFAVDEPGTYALECYTPADEDNFIGKGMRIR